MAETNTNTFEESPDTVELKGAVTGVTRLSKQARILILTISMAIMAFIIFSIYSIDSADDPTDAAQQEQDEAKKKSGPDMANPGSMFDGISDGQASHGLGSPTNPNLVTIEPGMRVPTVTPTTPQVPAPNVQALTPEQKAAELLKQQRNQARMQALAADLEIGNNFAGSSNGTAAIAQPGGFQQTGLSGAANQPGLSAGGIQQQDDLNKQIRKANFLKEAENQPDKSYLNELKRSPIGKYEIKTGWLIPAVLESGINSDLPGQVCARVRENVYDTRTGKYLLIPQGTKTCGVYDSQISMGQTRILLVWNRLIFEDGSSINLQGMPGADQAGYSGFDGDVDNHYLKIFGGAILMTVISAGAQLSQPAQSTNNTNSTQTTGQTMSAALGQQLGQVGSALIQRDLQIQPTITQAPGYRFNIMVTRDMILPPIPFQ